MARLNRDSWALKLALITAQRSTCFRRAVGCVLLNVRGHVLATGYNGVAASLPHCNEEIFPISKEDTLPHALRFPHMCAGALAPSGTQLDACQAIHAEQNALLQCADVHAIHTCYVTTSPCMTCTKQLLNTGCQRIVYLDEYPHTAAGELWQRTGRLWERHGMIL